MAAVKNPGPAPAQGSSPARFRLLSGSLEIDLAPGVTVMGRDASCDVVVEDALASRRHAQIRCDESSAVILDLASANGTWVNGERLSAARSLAGGDWITVGRQEYQLVDLRAQRTSGVNAVGGGPPSSDRLEGGAGWYRQISPSARAPKSGPPKTPVPSSSSSSRATTPGRSPLAREDLFADEPQESTAQINTFQLFAKIAESAFAASEDERAKQILSAQFRAILDGARQRGSVAPDAAEFMARFAVKLASVTDNVAWLDALVRVYTIARRPLPATAIEELQASIRKFSALDRAALRDYVEVLRAMSATMSSAERLSVQRIAGIEQALSRDAAELRRS
jgi:hypothetical protein